MVAADRRARGRRRAGLARRRRLARAARPTSTPSSGRARPSGYRPCSARGPATVARASPSACSSSIAIYLDGAAARRPGRGRNRTGRRGRRARTWRAAAPGSGRPASRDRRLGRPLEDRVGPGDRLCRPRSTSDTPNVARAARARRPPGHVADPVGESAAEEHLADGWRCAADLDPAVVFRAVRRRPRLLGDDHEPCRRRRRVEQRRRRGGAGRAVSATRFASGWASTSSVAGDVGERLDGPVLAWAAVSSVALTDEGGRRRRRGRSRGGRSPSSGANRGRPRRGHRDRAPARGRSTPARRRSPRARRAVAAPRGRPSAAT